jgi:hypothetical protein
VAIHREEVYRRVHALQATASVTGAGSLPSAPADNPSALPNALG